VKKHNIAKPTASSKGKLTEKALMIGNHMSPGPPKKPRCIVVPFLPESIPNLPSLSESIL